MKLDVVALWVQEDREPMHSYEHQCSMLSRLRGLHEFLKEHLGVIGLWYIAYSPTIRTHFVMMTTLAKRWYNETSSFHLPLAR